MKLHYLGLMALICVLIVGCGGGDSAASSAQPESLVQSFGESLLKKDFGKAKSLLSADCKDKDKLEESFTKWCENGGAPKTVDVDSGELPSSADDAKDWGIPSNVPLDKMKAWMVCEMRGAEQGGFDLWVLVVEGAGGLKIGYFQFGPPD